MNPENRIEWNPPSPRTGFLGFIDGLIGPGATRAELWVQFLPAAIAAAAAVLWPVMNDLTWPWWKLAVAAFLGLDMVGGALTNATNAAKRWNFREGRGPGSHLGFIAIHIIQLAAVGWLFRDQDWIFVAACYSFLLIGLGTLASSPRYLQRLVGVGLLLIALIADACFLAPTVGLEWFLPMFYLKLFVSHLLPEAPWAPDPDASSK